MKHLPQVIPGLEITTSQEAEVELPYLEYILSSQPEPTPVLDLILKPKGPTTEEWDEALWMDRIIDDMDRAMSAPEPETKYYIPPCEVCGGWECGNFGGEL